MQVQVSAPQILACSSHMLDVSAHLAGCQSILLVTLSPRCKVLLPPDECRPHRARDITHGIGWVEGALKTSVVAHSKIKPKLDSLTGLRTSRVGAPGVPAENNLPPGMLQAVPTEQL